MKISPVFLAILFICFLITACSSPTPTPTETNLPALPTPDVPPIEEIDDAIEAWENSNITKYFIEVDEENQIEHFKVRLVVEDSEIRVAQRLDLGSDGNWGEPYSIPHEEAQGYTIGSLLTRIKGDVLGEGDALYNMVTAFNDTFGYPLYVHAEALPTFSETGTLELNRQFNYDIITTVKTLLEDSYGTEDQPIFTLIRSDGPQAWCDNLRIYADGASFYLDDCRDDFLQIPTPESRMAMLDQVRSKFNLLDETRTQDGQTQRLVIAGTGQGKPDAATVEEAWVLSTELHKILSEPTGLGLLMSYVYNGEYFGFDVFNKISLPSQLTKTGDLIGATLTPDGELLAFSDDNGINVFTVQTQDTTLLLPAPEEGYYMPRTWSDTGRLLVSHFPGNEDDPIRHGWLSLEQPTWHDLPTPQSVSEYGCDTGMAWSPEGDQLAVTGIGYGDLCNTNPGLTIIDLSEETAEVVVAPLVNTVQDDGSTLIAGAHTPAWSPDGNWIAFGLDQDPNGSTTFPTRLYRAHSDGSNLTPLTNNSNGFATNPVWAEDGSLYYGLSNADADLDGLYHYSPTDNAHTLLLPGNAIHPLSLSPDGEYLLYEQGQALKIWRILLQETISEITGEEENFPSFSGWIEAESEK
ncbi:MAG: hypothetical protein ACK2UM_13965 [Anaerolineales bacterium]